VLKTAHVAHFMCMPNMYQLGGAFGCYDPHPGCHVRQSCHVQVSTSPHSWTAIWTGCQRRTSTRTLAKICTTHEQGIMLLDVMG